MGVNKVDVGGETVLDLTGDTVSAENLIEGATAHNAAGEKITGTAKIPTKTSELTNDSGFITAQDIYNPNLILNPNFKVNSKGQLEYTGEEGPDRWISLVGHKVTIFNGGIRVTCTGSANRGVYQNFEYELEPGKYTASIKVTDINGSLYFWIGGGRIIITKSGIYKITIDPEVKMDGITIQVPVVGEWAEIEWVKLEYGGNMTPFFPPNSNLEKLKCGAFDVSASAEGAVSDRGSALKAAAEPAGEIGAKELVPTKIAEIMKTESELKMK